MERLLPTKACVDELNNGQDNFNTDLRLFDQNLETSPGGNSRVLENNRNIKHGDSNDRSGANKIFNKTFKRDRSESRSSNDDESLKPRHDSKLQSVLVKPHRQQQQQLADEARRKALIESQRGDKQVFDRNKRMFGMLVGTLRQFKNEETGRERLTLKRSRIEEKLELAVEKERACIDDKTDRAVRNDLSEEEDGEDRIKLDTINRFKNWEQSHIHLRSYIQTQTKPKIFWLPKEHNSLTEKRLRETKDYFSLCIAERTAKLRKELDDFDNNSKSSNDNCLQSSPKDHRRSRSPPADHDSGD